MVIFRLPETRKGTVHGVSRESPTSAVEVAPEVEEQDLIVCVGNLSLALKAGTY